MPKFQTKKLTTQEKQLQKLRMQLYGKSDLPTIPGGGQQTASSSATFTFPAEQPALTPKNQSKTVSDIIYLRQDLKKSGILAATIFAVQALLFLSINRGLIKF